MNNTYLHSFAYRNYLPPSVWADFFTCKRRFYFQANHLFPYHDPDQVGIHHQFQDEEFWQREVRLPSGARIDLWIGSEKVGIEYKSYAPEFAHAVQVWEMQDELMQLGITKVQMQLWYEKEFEKEAKLFAQKMKWEVGINELDYVSLLVEPPDLEQLYELEQTKHFILDHIEDKQQFLHEKPETGNTCLQCRFFEFCKS
jgi:CRISPR/Cas system-associated exonuclease Cas4 (RecB family)